MNRNGDSGKFDLDLGVLAVRTVVDESRRPLAGALVTVSGGGATMTAVSDAEGLAHFGLQSPGEYHVLVRKSRYRTVRGALKLELGPERVARVVVRSDAGQLN